MRGILGKFGPGGGGGGKDTSSLLNKVIQVSTYTLRCEELVGAGGYASIYRCVDQNTTMEYALKHLRLPPDSDAVAEVRQEMKIMYQLGNHPNILKLHAASFAGPPGKETDAFMVMDFCRVTLLDEMQRCKFQLDHFFVYEVFSEVCQGVAHMHLFSPPYAHRDIKAENVLKTDKGKWVLCDFGSATTKAQVYESPAERAMEEEVIRRTTTPAYRSPEMWDLINKQRIDTKVDIWALGVLLYVLIYGKLPFQGDSKLSILFGKYDMPPGKPAAFCDLIRDLLTTDPAQRPDILTVLSRLDGVKQSLYNSVTAGTPPPTLSPPTSAPSPTPTMPIPGPPPQLQPAPQRHVPAPHLHPGTAAPMPVANGLSRVSPPLGQPLSFPPQQQQQVAGAIRSGMAPGQHGIPVHSHMPQHPSRVHGHPHMAASMPQAAAVGVHSHPVAVAPVKVPQVPGVPSPVVSAPQAVAAAGAVPTAAAQQPQQAAHVQQPMSAKQLQQQQAYAQGGQSGSLRRSMQIQPAQAPSGPVHARAAADVVTRTAGATPLYVPQEGALQLPAGAAVPSPAASTTAAPAPPPVAAAQETETATLIDVDVEPAQPEEQQQSLLGSATTTPTKKASVKHSHKRSSSFSKANNMAKDSSQTQHLFEPDWGDQPAFMGGNSAAVPTKSGHSHSASVGHPSHVVPTLSRTSQSHSQSGAAATGQRASENGPSSSSSIGHGSSSLLPPQHSSSAAAPAAPGKQAASRHGRSSSKGSDGWPEPSSLHSSGHGQAPQANAAAAQAAGNVAGGSSTAYELEALRVQVKGLLATQQSLSFRVQQLEATVVEQAELIKALQKRTSGSGHSSATSTIHKTPSASVDLPTLNADPGSPGHYHRGAHTAADATASGSPHAWQAVSPKQDLTT